MKKFYISTAILYSSAKPHIGNLYEMILADSIARFKKLDNYLVYFQTGVDEHGQKILDNAVKNNKTPQVYVDEMYDVISKLYDNLDIKYDKFVRTTNSFHQDVVSKIFERLFKNGDIYLDKYSGYYSKREESFILEKDLVDGKTKSGETPIWTEEEGYFFNLKKYQKRLLDHINKNPNFIYPESRKNEMLKNFLEQDLIDVCITRTSFDWGIPLSFDKKHVVYVWIDALLNYITGLGYDGYNFSDEMKDFWPCNIHLIGKDILRFHAIFWPILLMALDIELPSMIFAHPWILFNKDKMSKSYGNVMYSDDLVKLFGVDPVRYYCLHEIPYKEDGNITYELLVDRNNSDLANTVGNLLNRSLGMLKKYRDTKLTKKIILDQSSKDLEDDLVSALDLIRKNMDDIKISDSLEVVIDLARKTNKYIDLQMPWALYKNNEEDKLNNCLYHLFESIRFIGILLQPFLPRSASIILDTLKVEDRSFESLKEFGILTERELIAKDILFERFDIDEILKKVSDND